MTRTITAVAIMGMACITATSARAGTIPFATTETSKYLLVGNGPVNDQNGRKGIGQAVNMNNFELGANKAPVPSTASFLNSGGGPTLLGNVPDIPLNAKPVGSGIFNDGNVAITSPGGTFNLQDVGVYADLGVHCAQLRAACDDGTQNSFFNDPNQFPNTFTPTGFTNPGVNNNTGGTGIDINPGAANQSTRMDDPNFAGVTGGVNLNGLLAELFGPGGAQQTIPGLAATGTLDVSGNGGKIDSDLTFNLANGLNIIDIVTGGNDFSVENKANFVIDGDADDFVIFRVPDFKNMKIANANILIGNGGIGLNNVLFYSDTTDQRTVFDFSNTVINGVAFWWLGTVGSSISIDNAQGCTQLIADKIELSDVRFNRCAFGTTTQVPEPASLALLATALFGLGAARRPCLSILRRTASLS